MEEKLLSKSTIPIYYIKQNISVTIQAVEIKHEAPVFLSTFKKR